jgi:hypothetical protein
MPKSSAREGGKSGQILFQFVHGLLPNLTRRLKSEFSRFPRASRACLLPINRPLSFKRRVLNFRYRNYFLEA